MLWVHGFNKKAENIENLLHGGDREKIFMTG